MKFLAAAISFFILSVSGSQAQNFNQALSILQNSSWTGTFSSIGPGPAICNGSLTVRFFSLGKESFGGGAQTLSYRHNANFSPATPFFPFCAAIGKGMSVVDLGNCSGGRKASVEGGKKVMVPVRTIIAKGGGAVVSSPTCVADGRGGHRIQRSEFPITHLEFTDAGKRNAVRISISLPGISITYDLKRAGR